MDISVGDAIDVPAGGTVKQVIFTVPAAKKFNLTQATFKFDSTAEFKVKIRVLQGLRNVIPYEGWARTDGDGLRLAGDVVYESGESVVVEVKNEDTASAHTVSVYVQGVLQ